MNLSEKERNGICIGDMVRTRKGGRFKTEGPFNGEVVGFGMWRGYIAANVKKEITGKVVQCLVKNLVRITTPDEGEEG